MRAILFVLSIFMLSGCLQHEPADNQSVPLQNQALPAANITENPVSGNITAPPRQNQTTPESGNESNPSTNQSTPQPGNQTNQTTNPQQNQTTPQPGNQTNQSASNENPPEETPPQPAIPQGLAFGNGSYLLVLDDVSIIPTSSGPCGIFSVRLASDGSVLDKMLICTGESENWVSPDGGSHRILVVNVAAGYGGQEKWAKVMIYG